MSLESTATTLPVCKNATRGRLFTRTAAGQQKIKSSVAFLGILNPFTWFNEFSNIEITLEEFAPAKKNKHP